MNFKLLATLNGNYRSLIVAEKQKQKQKSKELKTNKTKTLDSPNWET